MERQPPGVPQPEEGQVRQPAGPGDHAGAMGAEVYSIQSNNRVIEYSIDRLTLQAESPERAVRVPDDRY